MPKLGKYLKVPHIYKGSNLNYDIQPTVNIVDDENRP